MDEMIRLVMFLGATALAGVCWVFVGPQSTTTEQMMSEYLVPKATAETKKVTQGFADFAQNDPHFKKRIRSGTPEARSPASGVRR